MAQITLSNQIAGTPRDIFHFLSKPSNLVSISPKAPSLSFHSPQLMLGKGQLVHFDLSYGLFRVRWCSKITEFKPFSFFESTLQEGPLKKWVHRVSFSEEGENTLVRDEIDYEVGYGPFGKVLESLVMNYRIENFYRTRQVRATEKFQVIKKRSA